jgi:AraC-like DNA-binding protein
MVYIDSVFMSNQLPWLLRQPENALAIRALVTGNDPAWIFRPPVEQTNRVRRVFGDIANSSADDLPGRTGNTTSLRDLARLFDVLEVVRVLLGCKLPMSSAAKVALTTASPMERSEVIMAARLLSDELGATWTLRRLASAVNISPSHLSALFRADLGAPPMSYLMELRLQRLAYLLVTTSLTVAETALRSGWHNQDYAARLFRRRFGVSPTGYRRLMEPVAGEAAARPAHSLPADSGQKLETGSSSEAAGSRRPERTGKGHDMGESPKGG